MERCLFCDGEEPGYKPPENTHFVCSHCTQYLANAQPENLRAAYDEAVRINKPDLVNFLKNYVEEDYGNNQTGRNLDREGTVRAAKSAHHEKRPERSAELLGKGRPQVRRESR